MNLIKYAFVSYGGKFLSDTCGLAFTILLVLKLVDKISCSYLWVTSPVWGPLILLAGLYYYVRRQYTNAHQNALIATLAATSREGMKP